MQYFMMSVSVAEEFFKRCLEKEAITEKERLQVMQELLAERKLMAQGHTDLTKEEFAKELSRGGKSVLVIKGKEHKPKLGFDFKQEDK
jgi:hypothetical protein